MRRFVAEQNIRHFKRLLETEMDPGQRAVVTELLAEATQELAEATREFERLENATRPQVAETLRVANDYAEQGAAQRSQGSRSR